MENRGGEPQRRRTQQQRSASMRETLVSATLRSLTDDGFNKTTVSNICSRAGISRGALLHHFPNKNDLLVAAYVSWLSDKLQSLGAQSEGNLSIRNEIMAWRQKMEATFAVTHEFYWALRNDDDLRERFVQTLQTHEIGSDERLATFGNALDNAPRPELSRYVIACFIRGLCFQMLFIKDSSTIDAIFDHFVDMVTGYVRSVPRPRSTAA